MGCAIYRPNGLSWHLLGAHVSEYVDRFIHALMGRSGHDGMLDTSVLDDLVIRALHGGWWRPYLSGRMGTLSLAATKSVL